MRNNRIVEELKAWSEQAILCAEIGVSPGVEALRQIIVKAKEAGLTNNQIKEVIWTPYCDEVDCIS